MKIKLAIGSLASLIVALSPKAANAYPPLTGQWEWFASGVDGVTSLSVDVGSVRAQGTGFSAWIGMTTPRNTTIVQYIYISCSARQEKIIHTEEYNSNRQLIYAHDNFPSQVISVNSLISTVWSRYCSY